MNKKYIKCPYCPKMVEVGTSHKCPNKPVDGRRVTDLGDSSDDTDFDFDIEPEVPSTEDQCGKDDQHNKSLDTDDVCDGGGDGD